MERQGTTGNCELPVYIRQSETGTRQGRRSEPTPNCLVLYFITLPATGGISNLTKCELYNPAGQFISCCVGEYCFLLLGVVSLSYEIN